MTITQPPEEARSAERKRDIARALLRLLGDAEKRGATSLRLVPPAGAEPTGTIEFLTGRGAPLQAPMRAQELTELAAALQEHAFHWPELGDEHCQLPQPSVRRVLFAPQTGLRIAGDLMTVRRPGTAVQTISLENIVYELPELPLKDLVTTDYPRRVLQQAAAASRGIVLTNTAASPFTLDGSALLSALQPAAIKLTRITDRVTAAAAVSLAQSQLVVVALPGQDPVQLAFNFLGLLSADPRAQRAAVALYNAVFVQLRVKRSCASCSRSTAIPASTLERIPEVLRSALPTSYLFGRGCVQCGFTAYRGTIGLESAMQFDDELRKSLFSDGSAELATRSAHRAGTRCLLEDGIEKIFAGQTSFEEVFAVTSQLPASFAAAIKSSREAERNAPASAATAPGRRTRMMIVEDDASQRQVLELVFQSEGYEVTTAPNGKEALRLLRNAPIDIIVCDLMMPELDGLGFVKQLRSLPSFEQLPVLMLTAADDAEREYDLLSVGADDYCRKTIRRKVLIKRVERLLSRRKKDNPLEHFLSD